MNLLAELREQLRPMHRGIALALWIHVGLLLFALAALPLDHRTILGLNPWIKPMKFDISVMVYLLTAGLLLAHLSTVYRAAGRGWPRSASVVGWAIAISMVIEDSAIAMQSMRGVRSHMNYTSLFDGIVFGVMGVFIALNTVALAFLLLLYLDPRSRLRWPAAVVAGARLGLLVILLGSVEGVTMVANGHHTVGAQDTGGGLPFVNWSTSHGDLRVAHFFALHALQIFLLTGWMLSQTRASRSSQIGALVTFAVVYTAGCGWLFHVAMQGRPLLGI